MESARLRCIIAIFAVIAAMTLYTDISMGQADLANGLVSYWSFDIDARDDHGSRNGTVYSAQHITAGHKLGDGAYQFNGNGWIDFGRRQFRTISFWIKVGSGPSYHLCMGAQYHSDEGLGAFNVGFEIDDYIGFRAFVGIDKGSLTITDPLGPSDQSDISVTVTYSVPSQLSNIASETYYELVVSNSIESAKNRLRIHNW